MNDQPVSQPPRSKEIDQKPLDNLDYELFIFVFTCFSLIIACLLLFVPLAPATEQILVYFNFLITIIFLGDFFYLLRRAINKMGYLKSQGWLDLLGSLPYYPLFRFFRLYRMFVVWRVLRRHQGEPVWKVMRKRRAENVLRYTALAVFFVIATGSALVLQFESTIPGGNIRTPQEAIWWAVVTIATVGYGDFYPVTLDGRLVGMILMIVGVGMFGVLSSYLATNFLKPTKEEKADQDQAINESRIAAFRREIEPLQTEIAALRIEIAQLHQALDDQKTK